MEVHLNKKLPKMAWFVELKHDGSPKYFEHGDSVVLTDEFAFEGTFSGEVSGQGIANSNVSLGSGFVQEEDGTLFITPSHTLEGLFIVRNQQRKFVTNSNVIAYHLAGISASHLAVKIGWRIKYGIGEVPQQIEKTKDAGIKKISYFNFRITDNRLVLIEKTKDPNFYNFSQYFDYLVATGRKLQSNLRKLSGFDWNLMGTVSTGFDSVACLALGKTLGCKKAVTLQNGRGNVNDNGAQIAQSIGIECTEYVRPFSELTSNSRIALTYDDLSDCAEFVAAGTLAEDVCYLPFEASVANTILLTGFQADKLWGRKFTPSSSLERGDISGSSMGEFRLRVGFVHWPVPYIGCRSNKDLLEITFSDELEDYRDESNYNKPIAIKMAESVGIPRDLYGLKKKAASVLFDESPNALPVSLYRQQLKYGLVERKNFVYSECIDLAASRSPKIKFTEKYHNRYSVSLPNVHSENRIDLAAASVEIHIFGRSVGLVSVKISSGVTYFDALSGYVEKLSTSDLDEPALSIFKKIHDCVLPELRDLSNNKKQYVHFNYSTTSGQFVSIYDQNLDFPSYVNYYLGSLWQGETGVA